MKNPVKIVRQKIDEHRIALATGAGVVVGVVATRFAYENFSHVQNFVMADPDALQQLLNKEYAALRFPGDKVTTILFTEIPVLE